MQFNEDSRVKIPALLHLIRLGYSYLPAKRHKEREGNTNIFKDIFIESLSSINPNVTTEELTRLLEDITRELDFEDLGEKFYNRLISKSGIKLIDFENFDNNQFHIATELVCKNGEEEFRPDITILINGLPLAFIEVKKRHNKEGVLAERTRMNKRFQNKNFRRFINITQLMVFSNNMEYQDGVVEPLFGSFYATTSRNTANFNYFREDPDFPVTESLQTHTEYQENLILADNNLTEIKHSPEFITNKDPDTPANRILTSLFSRERLSFILNYSFAYVEKEVNGAITKEKHIMRYPQIFATMAIKKTLDEGKDKGIIWHTQGSGKTALAYFNVKHLTDYYQKQNIIPKFYFIVDRLDLLIQAQKEFLKRGLRVNIANSRQDFTEDLKKSVAVHNDEGKPEITVVNIQKFGDDFSGAPMIDYAINTQRVYFLDEAHRSYNPFGSYFANLLNSDRKSVKIALTGTPLLRAVAKDYDSTDLFGDYIHKYYYNSSIADGYTLRLIREEIEGTFKMEMKELLDKIEVEKGKISTSEVLSDRRYAEGMFNYIIDDLYTFRNTHRDNSLGGMVVCDSSKQARMLFHLFEERFGKQETDAENLPRVAEPTKYDRFELKHDLKAALILHDENDKTIRKDLVEAYKSGKIDVLFVFNMLLTGFDAHRLKKLYLARVVKDHNLLQTLTRVNRPYKKYEYGYIVDFADISEAFDRTNQLYFQELNAELGDDIEHYSKLFKSIEEIEQEIEEIKDILFEFNTENKEEFSKQLEEITDKRTLLDLAKALRLGKELRNIIRVNDYEELRGVANFEVWNRLLIETQNKIDNINTIERLKSGDKLGNILDEALEDIDFRFEKIGEVELRLVDEYKDQLRKTRLKLNQNFDQKDPEFISLREELEEIFKRKNLREVTQEDLRENMTILQHIYDKAKVLNDKNERLKSRYEGDDKYVRIHKRITEQGMLNVSERTLHSSLLNIRKEVNEKLIGQEDLIGNEAYFKQMTLQLIIQRMKNEAKIDMNREEAEKINYLISKEYTDRYYGRA